MSELTSKVISSLLNFNPKLTVLDKKTNQNQKGVSIVEFCIGLPLLVILLLGTWEVGSALVVYQEITHVARESAKLAARNSELAVGACTNRTTGAACESHKMLQLQIESLLAQSGFSALSTKTPNKFDITTELIDSKLNSSGSSEAPDLFQVKISGSYRGYYLFALTGMNVAVKETGPYLIIR